MDAVKTVVFSLCMVCLIAGVFHMLAPAGGLQRVSSMVIGLFTLICFLIPFESKLSLESLLDFSFQEFTPSFSLIEEYTDELEEATVEETVKTVEQIAGENAFCATVTGVKTKQQEGRMYVEQISVTVDGTKEQALAFQEKIALAVDCEVVVAWTKES